MADENDGVEESIDGALRIALTMAARVGERLARAREDALRHAAADQGERARRLAVRFEAQRVTAQATLQVVDQPEWWNRATPDRVARAHETATQWKDHDPDVARYAATIENEVRDRYGIDVNHTRTDPAAVRDALARAAAEQQDTGQHTSTQEHAEAALLIDAADRADRAADYARTTQARDISDPRTDIRDQAPPYSDDTSSRTLSTYGAYDGGGVKYDSAERRQKLAADLGDKGIPGEAINARVGADIGQGRPATEAVQPGRATSTSPGRPRAGQLLQRHDRER